MSQLKIFISSTCYDLSQIRQDLSEAIISWGHKPLMSERISFPVNPDLSNEENCIRTVRDEADIFVLIIGSRYGYKVDSGKSITNIEYHTAVEKGIPIYTFTHKQLVSIFPVWAKNPDADFSIVVDDNRIFEFIRDVRYKSNKWNYQFENANDIINTLREQLSILFKHSLKIQQKYDNVNIRSIQDRVTATAYRYLVDKNDNYEFKFFAQCMIDCIEEHSHLKHDLEYAIISLSDKHLKASEEIIDYVQLMLGRMKNIIDSLNRLLGNAFPVYFGEPGCPSNIEGLYYVAQTYSKLYALLITCAIEARSIVVPDKYDMAMELLSKVPLQTIQEIEAFPNNIFSQIKQAEEQYAHIKEPMCVDLTLKVTLDEVTSNKLFNELHRVVGI